MRHICIDPPPPGCRREVCRADFVKRACARARSLKYLPHPLDRALYWWYAVDSLWPVGWSQSRVVALKVSRRIYRCIICIYIYIHPVSYYKSDENDSSVWKQTVYVPALDSVVLSEWSNETHWYLSTFKVSRRRSRTKRDKSYGRVWKYGAVVRCLGVAIPEGGVKF